MALNTATGNRAPCAANGRATPQAARVWSACERGYAMAALLVGMSIMAVALSVALPAWNTFARREREAELIFRGEQYARAVALFQRRYGNTLPPTLDVLINERFLRKRYKDPITGEDFQLIGPGTALPGVPGAAEEQGGRGGSPAAAARQQLERLSAEVEARRRAANDAARGVTPAGGILGVASRSTEKSLRLYNGRERYNEWVFLATDMTRTPDGAGGAQVPGPQVPGGRGGRGGTQLPGGRGGTQPPGGRGGTQPPPGGRF